jgi:large conductance mechanosensitive channel
MIKEFREFLEKGNIMDAAFGLILALAFVPVVGSLIAAIFGQPDFSRLSITIGDAHIL